MGPWLVVTVTLSHLLPTVLSATLLLIPITCRLKCYIKLLHLFPVRLLTNFSPLHLHLTVCLFKSVLIVGTVFKQDVNAKQMFMVTADNYVSRNLWEKKILKSLFDQHYYMDADLIGSDGIYLKSEAILLIRALLSSVAGDTLPSCRLNTKLKKLFRNQSLSLYFFLRRWQQCTLATLQDKCGSKGGKRRKYFFAYVLELD